MTSDKKDIQKRADLDKQTGDYASELKDEFPDGLDQEGGDTVLKNLLKSPPKPHEDLKKG